MCIASVIIPIFNAQSTLRKCLDSVLNQTFIDYEVICVDDGSSDLSGEICEEYALNNPKIRVFHQANRGVCAARNLGLMNAKGEYILFCDSDDWVEREWLSQLISMTTLLPRTLPVHAINLVGPYGGGYKGVAYEFNVDVKDGIQTLKSSDTLGYLVNKIFDRRIIEQNNIRFGPNLRFREDEDFVLKYLMHIERIVYSPNLNYNYLIPNLSTKYRTVQMFDVSLSMYRSVLVIFKDVNVPICYDYKVELINSFFDTYRFGNYSVDKIVDFLSVLNDEDLTCISNITRLILKLPKKSCNVLLLIKSKMSNMFIKIRGLLK